MKLILERKQGEDIDIKIKEGDIKKKFSYIEMIKSLRDKNEFEEPEFIGDITPEEQESVRAMLLKISSEITEKKVEEAD